MTLLNFIGIVAFCLKSPYWRYIDNINIMKTYKITSKKWIAGLGAVCLLSVFLTSCLKSKTDTYNPPSAYVLFAQASPGQQPIDLYLNNNLVNSLPINYGYGIDYFRAFAGNRIVNIYSHVGMSKILSDSINLKTDSAYSLFMVGKAGSAGILLLSDPLTQPASGQAGIRFVNVSPDAPAVDLAIKDSAAFITNKAFKGYSPFLPIQGGKTYTFEVRRHGTNTVLATISNANIAPGLVYTVWLHGLTATAIDNDKLKADVITNAYY